MANRSKHHSEISWAEMCCFGFTCLQIFWARVVVRKWLNITGGIDSDYSADSDDEDYDQSYLDSDSDTQETLGAQCINSKEIRICVGTWNVAGKLPPDDLDIDNWIDINDPADIYVLGFQEIVPLNACNIFGVEDSRPVTKWENIIRETLKIIQHEPTKIKCFSEPPSPSKSKPSEDVPNIEEILLDSDEKLARRTSSYVRIFSKQMVGIFLTVWIRRGLRRHIQNVKVSTVGVGILGYLGNKGSISVSMSIYQTLFCFICTHLKSGEKDGDQLKRNADVHKIHRRTLFHSMSGVGLPRSIYDHERIIWLGDLNYRLNLPYETTTKLISEKRWSKLFEMDQLAQELRKGCTFDGWSEGTINFAPTYKYEINSEKYYGEDPRAGRRNPAWCDRILSYGKEMKQLSYTRSEFNLSDHRPVTAIYIAEVEVICPTKLQRALTFTNEETENENALLLPRNDALSA